MKREKGMTIILMNKKILFTKYNQALDIKKKNTTRLLNPLPPQKKILSGRI